MNFVNSRQLNCVIEWALGIFGLTTPTYNWAHQSSVCGPRDANHWCCSCYWIVSSGLADRRKSLRREKEKQTGQFRTNFIQKNNRSESRAIGKCKSVQTVTILIDTDIKDFIPLQLFLVCLVFCFTTNCSLQFISSELTGSLAGRIHYAWMCVRVCVLVCVCVCLCCGIKQNFSS